MKTIIAGSRTIGLYRVVVEAIESSGYTITELVSGGAVGVDRLGERWAKENGVPIAKFIPDWNKYLKRAGFVRNEQMVNYADALIAVWDGTSRGTKHTIDLARRKGIPVFVHTPFGD